MISNHFQITTFLCRVKVGVPVIVTSRGGQIFGALDPSYPKEGQWAAAAAMTWYHLVIQVLADSQLVFITNPELSILRPKHDPLKVTPRESEEMPNLETKTNQAFVVLLP